MSVCVCVCKQKELSQEEVMALEGQTSYRSGSTAVWELGGKLCSSRSVARENTVVAANSLPREHDQKWTGAAQDCQSAWLRAPFGRISTSSKVME